MTDVISEFVRFLEQKFRDQGSAPSWSDSRWRLFGAKFLDEGAPDTNGYGFAHVDIGELIKEIDAFADEFRREKSGGK